MHKLFAMFLQFFLFVNVSAFAAENVSEPVEGADDIANICETVDPVLQRACKVNSTVELLKFVIMEKSDNLQLDDTYEMNAFFQKYHQTMLQTAITVEASCTDPKTEEQCAEVLLGKAFDSLSDKSANLYNKYSAY